MTSGHVGSTQWVRPDKFVAKLVKNQPCENNEQIVKPPLKICHGQPILGS